jgi:uncharacterized protein (TIGR02145 family)
MKNILKITVIVFLSIGALALMQSCKKNSTSPVLTTEDVSGITQTSVVSGGTIVNDGGAEITSRGVCWSTTNNPTISSSKTTDGKGTGSFTTVITGLMVNTIYYVRAYAINSEGIGYGNEVSFTTNQIIKGSTVPTLTTTVVTSITSESAVSGGTITDDGGGDIIAKGISWNTTPDWYIYSDDDAIDGAGTGSGSFVSHLSGLTPGTTYYVKAYAVNSMGIGFGHTISFTTEASIITKILFNSDLTYGTVDDIDGNIYKTIQIGEQTWMAENLKSTKFNDGESIPLVTDNAKWGSQLTPGYSWYNNDPVSYKDIYGALYNWYTAASRKLCPAGWRVPDSNDYNVLYNYLGADSVVGSRMKEIGYTHWLSPNNGANNSSGFTGLPGGVRRADGLFVNLHFISNWWTTSEAQDPGVAISAYLNSDITNLYLLDYSTKSLGSSVRCIKN